MLSRRLLCHAQSKRVLARFASSKLPPPRRPPPSSNMRAQPLPRRPPPNSNSSLDPPQPHLREVLDALQAYESRYTYRGWHVLRYVGIFVVTASGLVIYNWSAIRKLLSQETSELAQQTMQDEGLQQEVDRITQQTTNTLLNDPHTVQVSLEFLVRLLQKPETRRQVVSFFSKVITDPTTVQALATLLRDPVTIRQLQSSLNTLLNDPTIRRSLNDLVFELLKDPQTQRLLEQLVMDLLQRPHVKESTSIFFGNVLRTDQVIDAATDSSRQVVANLSRDEDVHKNLASAGTSAVKRMVIPGFMFRHHHGPKKLKDEEHDEVDANDKDATRAKEEEVVVDDEIATVESLVQDQEEASYNERNLSAQ